MLKSGTIVDATIISAPSSTKNAGEERDPEMRQTRKGKQWYFGMKVHVGTDKKGLVHSVATGPANEGDITRLDELLHGEESELYGDQAYWSEDHRLQCKHARVRYRVNRGAKPGSKLTQHEKSINRSRSRRRARGEFAFHVVKRLWGLKGALPLDLQEYGPYVDDVCTGQSVPGATTIVAARGSGRP